jgi:hypothetical protein
MLPAGLLRGLLLVPLSSRRRLGHHQAKLVWGGGSLQSWTGSRRRCSPTHLDVSTICGGGRWELHHQGLGVAI